MDLPPIYKQEGPGQQYAVLLTACKSFLGHCCGRCNNHMVTSHTSVVRVELITEMQAMTFRDSMRQGRRYWRTGDGNDVKLRVEADPPH